jgi:lysophospholipase L1-like esterase
MTPMRHVLLGLVCAALCGSAAQAAGTCPAIPPRNPMPVDATPAALTDPGWLKQVAALDAHLPSLERESRQLVFIGDSITAGWDPGLFSQFYGTRSPLLLGIIGDYTQGVLQRLQDEWGPLRPRLVVLLIGTNNTTWTKAPPEDVALGVAEIVRLIHRRSPATRVLIVGILPHGWQPSEPVRAVNAQVNALISRCADGQTTFYADVGRLLLNANGQLSNEVSFDGLHLLPVGYAILATALEPTIHRLMGE